DLRRNRPVAARHIPAVASGPPVGVAEVPAPAAAPGTPAAVAVVAAPAAVVGAASAHRAADHTPAVAVAERAHPDSAADLADPVIRAPGAARSFVSTFSSSRRVAPWRHWPYAIRISPNISISPAAAGQGRAERART